ncbi:MAG: colanic acid biosynthesis acetyltransferase WcaF [Phycisphaeraceae bacterium]|nr:MAG: colanic acid biosynthesis acetyltransferase WcaF [Phycisphaeraceae bacterium]
MTATWRETFWGLIGRHAFRCTFHNWYGVRRSILRRFGASLSATARLRPTAVVTHPWNLSMGEESSVGDHARIQGPDPVRLGDFVTVSQHAAVHTLIPGPGGAHGPVTIENDAWIATDAFVGPGVRVHEGAIVAARTTVLADVPPWTILGGDPPVVLGPREPPLGHPRRTAAGGHP